jgi:hypothetical protein
MSKNAASLLTIAVPVLAVLAGWAYATRGGATADDAAASPAPHLSWWSPLSAAELEAELLAQCEAREVGYRAELAAAPDDWMVQAKLAQSLLETNGSRIVPAPARLKEGRRLAEAAFAAHPKTWRAMLAKVALLLAETSDVDAEQASRLALAAVEKRSNRFTNKAMGLAYLVDGCALVCFARRALHRLKLDPEGAVYPEGKEPQKLAQSYMHTAFKRLVEAGKRLHAAFDHELFERDNTTYGPGVPAAVSEATLLAVFGPYVPLLQIEKIQGGVHPNTLFRAGGCDVFVGRKLNGKTCPGEEPEPRKKKRRKKSKKAEDGTAGGA